MMANSEKADSTWVFGYGSLIYKVDFPYLEKAPAHIHGWERRFWQGSHDHRGTPDAPGRVVTLVRAPGASCGGMAYRVEHDVFEHLDHREKNGYQRLAISIQRHRGGTVPGVMYLADEGNFAYLGPDSLAQVAAQISRARGPSGANIDYVLQLAQALRDLGERDEHVFALEKLLISVT